MTPLPCPPGIDLTRPVHELCADLGVGSRVVNRWRREAGVVVPRGNHRLRGTSGADIPRTRLLLLRLAGVDEVRLLTTEERQRLRVLLGVSRQMVHTAWEEGVGERTLAKWGRLAT